MCDIVGGYVFHTGRVRGMPRLNRSFVGTALLAVHSLVREKQTTSSD